MELDRRPSTVGREFMLTRVHEGLAAMRRHKEIEWNCQKMWWVARSHGHGVVDTSELTSASL